jgi:hypothetical protein
VASIGEAWPGFVRTTFSPGPAAGLGDEPDEGLGLVFAGLKLELGAGLDDPRDVLLVVAGVVVPAELAPVVRLDVFFADCDAEADVETGGHSCCEQGITGLVLTPLLAVSRTTITATAATRTVGRMTAQK